MSTAEDDVKNHCYFFIFAQSKTQECQLLLVSSDHTDEVVSIRRVETFSFQFVSSILIILLVGNDQS